MKFNKFKNEQELMDSIDPNNPKHRSLMADYAVSLHERFGITVEQAIEEAKRLLEAKKNGEEIISEYIEEKALDYKPPFVPVPRERRVNPEKREYTEYEHILFVSNNLFKEISAYHDIDDTEKREFYIKDDIEYFCEYYKMDKQKCVELLKALFRKKRRMSQFSYDYYRGNALNRIVGVPADPKYGKYDKMINSSERSFSFEETDYYGDDR